jgi:hypothetical protein
VNALGARLPIAGFVDKIPLHIVNGRHCLPEAGSGSATSVLLKARYPPFRFLREDGNFCMGLAGRVGSPVPVAGTVKIGGVFALSSDRYGRRMEGDIAARSRREGFRQAIALHPQGKYESNSVPSFSTCADPILDS